MPTYESLSAESKFFKGKLYQKMVDDLRLAGKAKRTVYGYFRAVRKLAEFCETAPDLIAEQDVREYLLHLIVERQGSQRSLLDPADIYAAGAAVLAQASQSALVVPCRRSRPQEQFDFANTDEHLDGAIRSGRRVC
jgi:hypothetical protein